MKTRMIIDGNIVWFGSYGKNEDGTAKFAKNEKIKINSDYNEGVILSYNNKKEGIVDSLIQRLSVIQGELWYNTQAGIPLLEKQRSKGIIDSYIATTVMSHPDVLQITEFTSSIVNNHIYTCSLKCSTIYGEININI